MSELTKSIWIDAPPEVVFPYLTESDKMAKWCGVSAELDPVPQGIYRLDMGGAGVMEGRFIRVEPVTFVSFEVDPPAGTEAPTSLIEISISPEVGGSRVEIRQYGLEAPFDLMASRGWDHHAARLSVVAEGGAVGEDSFCKRSLQSLI